LDYLKLKNGEYEVPREFSQHFYQSKEWKELRRKIIVRDKGMDLACPGFVIMDTIIVHHMNPVTLEQLQNNDPELWNPDNLISTSVHTHNIIHYRVKEAPEYEERKEGDTKLW